MTGTIKTIVTFIRCGIIIHINICLNRSVLNLYFADKSVMHFYSINYILIDLYSLNCNNFHIQVMDSSVIEMYTAK